MENADNTQISIEILNRLGITNLKQRNNQKIKCLNPSHEDKDPSMSVDLYRGIYHCFACGFSGRLTNLYYETFGHSIYKDLGIPSSYTSHFKSNVETHFSFDDVPEVDFTFIGKLSSIDSDENGIKWCKSRGFTVDFCKFNGIKFAKRCSIYKTSDPENDDEKRYYNDCAIIPIYEKNKLLSFEARDTLGKDEWKKKHPNTDYKKVLYPNNSSINTLYEYERLDTEKTLYITEGLMDMFSLRTHPYFKNSSCLFHCNPTERQLYLLRKFKEVVYIVDNDGPGLKACYSAMEKLDNLKYLMPPIRENIKDINDILQGKDKYIKTIDDLLNMGWLDNIRNSKEELKQIINLKENKDE